MEMDCLKEKKTISGLNSRMGDKEEFLKYRHPDAFALEVPTIFFFKFSYHLMRERVSGH